MSYRRIGTDMRRYVFAVVIGALLSALVVGLLGSLGPVTGPPRLSAHLWADYLALAGATGLSVMAVYGITVFFMSLCLFMAGWCSRLRVPAAGPEPAPEPIHLEEVQPWSS
jgi:hypothetical protein